MSTRHLRWIIVVAAAALMVDAPFTASVRGAEPTSDMTQTYIVSGLTRADLLDGALAVRVRATPGNSNTAFTASLDAVSITVDYTTPASPAAPTYDDNGNLTSDGSYGNRTYTYDTLGRLTGVTGNGVSATYTLDGAANRSAQTVNGSTTSFDLDLAQPNPTILSDGTNTFLPGLPAAGYQAAGTWWNGLVDQIGSPIEYVSTAGSTTTPVHLDPYGAPRPGSTASSGIGYAGEYRDPIGLVNLRARAYDPVLVRFTGRDSFGGLSVAPQSANRYAYGLGNPLRYVDRSGHFVNFVLSNPGLTAEIVFAVVAPEITAAYLFGAAVTGYDPLTGHSLSPIERGLYALPLVGKAASVFGAAWRDAGAALEGSGLRFASDALAAERSFAGEAGARLVGGEAGTRDAEELAASVISRTAQEQSARGVEALKGYLSAAEASCLRSEP